MKKLVLTLCFILFVGSGNLAFAKKENTLPLPTGNYDPILERNIVTDPLSRANKNFGPGVPMLEWFTHGMFLRGAGLTPKIYTVIGAIAILFLVAVGAKFLFSQGKSDAMSKSRTQLIWIILGMAVVSIAEFMAFYIWDPTLIGDKGVANLQNPDAVKGMLMIKVEQIKMYLQIAISGVMLVLLAVSGYNLVTAVGDESKLKNEKLFLRSFFAGGFLILLSETITKIISHNSPSEATIWGMREILGFVNYILSYVAVICTFMLVLAGLYYVSSLGNEDSMKRAKKIIYSNILAIVACISSYAIVSFLIR